ncbi:hypothetical protein [Micromonospora sp. MA102]|uniref:hypothetical protein n=1 Tax=Micromonospora sp. MA102 TaxID=2952755 RepID=UPI0021C6745F|nr:hypothetical protein [Micromonospora sp. MA102]
MTDVVWTAALTAAAAIGGVLVTVIADGAKEQRRLGHERTVRAEERREAVAARRASFELDNLIAAYDALWLLAREATKTHFVDSRAAETTDYGYGGTRLPEGTEADITVTSQAAKTIKLILDGEVRTLALKAQRAMNRASLLGVEAKIHGRGPVSLAEGEAVHYEAVRLADAALSAIAERIRQLVAEA